MSNANLLKSEKYKTLVTTLSATRTNKRVFESINDHFDPDDLYVFCDGNQTAEIWIRQVDMGDLKTFLESFTNTRQMLAADAILSLVEGIGSYGLNGRKRVYVGYNDERKVGNRKLKEARRGRHYYANDNDFVKRSAPVPKKFRNSILCGDSESVLKDIPDNCIDMVFTSPPYNFGLDYGGRNDAYDWESYFGKLFAILGECIRVLKYGGRLIINVQPLYSDYIPSHHIISSHLTDQKMIWRGEIMWEKNNYNCKYTAWGSWKSPSSPYLKYTWEFLEVFCKGDLKKAGNTTDADIDGDSFKKWVYGKWSIAPERNMRAYGHPAMFPEELARRAMLLFSFRGDVVLDPFVGAGTTCAVAKSNGRRYVGVDVNSEYCETARARLDGTLDLG